MPGGGVIIDTPGLRELQLWETDGGLDQTFVDVADLIAQCRFADCRHETEPDCAIKAALGRIAVGRAMGELPEAPARAGALERKLDPKLRSEQRKRWAAITKSHRHRRKVIGH